MLNKLMSDNAMLCNSHVESPTNFLVNTDICSIEVYLVYKE